MTFLEQISEYILTNEGKHLEDVVIIFPNIRAKVFLTEILSQKLEKTSWLPQMYSSKEFSELMANLKSAEDFQILALLFHSYIEVVNEEIEFGQFLNWGSSLLHDFKEIDQQNCDVDKLFSDLSDVRKMEVWNVEGEEPSVYQEKFIRFSKHLSSVYHTFTKKMEAQRLAHAGYIERKAAENTDFKTFHSDSKFLICGFNALTEAEHKIFKSISAKFETKFFWDYDTYYVDNEVHEAGQFARYNKKRYPQDMQWVQSNFTHVPKQLNIYQCTNSMEQTIYLSQIMEKFVSEKVNLQNTALVLADEKLLIPVLQHLPPSIDKVNVTMGYSLIHSPYFGIFEAILRLYFSAFTNKRSWKNGLYHKDVTRLIQEYGFKKLVSKEGLEKIQYLLNDISHHNIIFVNPESINELLESSYDIQFKEINSVSELLEFMKSILQVLSKNLREDKQVSAKMEAAFLMHHDEVLSSVLDIDNKIDLSNDYSTLIRLWEHYSELTKIQFSGEPLSGLQIMGLLETRNLDFENVIVLSVNEGTLPAGRGYNSLIPNDVKKEHKLLMHRDKEAVYAFHFYRLIQRSSKTHLLYSSQLSALGGGEKSRFIIQLKKELKEANPKHEINEYVVRSNVKMTVNSEKGISKSVAMIDNMVNVNSKGFSPTSLSDFLDCPLNFYYKHVIGLKDQEEAEENIEANVLGNILHLTLQELYKDLINKSLQKEHIEMMKLKYPKTLIHFFEETFSKKLYNQGKNKITFNLANRYIERFLDLELKRILKHEITVVALEEKLVRPLLVTIDSNEVQVKIQGKLDRLEKCDGILQIIDYKTGVVNPTDLKVDGLEALIEGRKNKLLQLLIYTWLVEHAYQSTEIMAGVYSFRSYNQGFIPAFIEKNRRELTNHDFKEIQHILQELIGKILNPKEEFIHETNAKYCGYC